MTHARKYGPLAPIERAACRLEVRRCMLYLQMRFSDDTLAKLMKDAGLADVSVSVGSRRTGDPFTVLIASGTKPIKKRT